MTPRRLLEHLFTARRDDRPLPVPFLNELRGSILQPGGPPVNLRNALLRLLDDELLQPLLQEKPVTRALGLETPAVSREGSMDMYQALPLPSEGSSTDDAPSPPIGARSSSRRIRSPVRAPLL